MNIDEIKYIKEDEISAKRLFEEFKRHIEEEEDDGFEDLIILPNNQELKVTYEGLDIYIFVSINRKSIKFTTELGFKRNIDDGFRLEYANAVNICLRLGKCYVKDDGIVFDYLMCTPGGALDYQILAVLSRFRSSIGEAINRVDPKLEALL